MTSIMRPSIIQRPCLSLASKRFLSVDVSASPAFRHRIAIPSSLLQKPSITKRSCLPSSMPAVTQVAAFQTSARRDILPPPPQRIEGTTNDPVKLPEPSPTHGNYHWTFERLMAASLIPLTIAPFAGGSLNPTTDAILCATLLIHSHIGFQACIIDYFPARRVPKTSATLWWTLRIATLVAAVGLYEFETNDVGLTEAIRRIWTAKRPE